MSIKYYHLAKDEELPDEFCAIRDIGGEPVEYTFYAPEAENAKMRHDLEEANNQAEEVCIENAKLRELIQDFDKCLTEAVRLAYIQGHATIYDGTLLDSLHPRMRELGVEVDG